MDDICCKCGQPLGMVRISITGGVPGGWLHSDCAKFNVPDGIALLLEEQGDAFAAVYNVDKSRLAEAERLLREVRSKVRLADMMRLGLDDPIATFLADQPSAGRTLAEVRDSLPDDRREAIEARTRELIVDKPTAVCECKEDPQGGTPVLCGYCREARDRQWDRLEAADKGTGKLAGVDVDAMMRRLADK